MHETLKTDKVQLDIEMPFSAYDNVKAVIEILVRAVYDSFTAGAEFELPPNSFVPFQTMRYEIAMRRHGVDKPDLRIKDLVSEIG